MLVALVLRDFDRGALDTVWVGDITYLRTWDGWVYLATVLDGCSRKVIGWALAEHMRSSLVVDALRMAVSNRRPPLGVIFHADADRGSQAVHLCRSGPLRHRPRHQALGRQDGRVLGQRDGRELLRDLEERAHLPPTQADWQAVIRAVIDHIEVHYNRRRWHFILGMISPRRIRNSTTRSHPGRVTRVHETGLGPIDSSPSLTSTPHYE